MWKGGVPCNVAMVMIWFEIRLQAASAVHDGCSSLAIPDRGDTHFAGPCSPTRDFWHVNLLSSSEADEDLSSLVDGLVIGLLYLVDFGQCGELRIQ